MRYVSCVALAVVFWVLGTAPAISASAKRSELTTKMFTVMDSFVETTERARAEAGLQAMAGSERTSSPTDLSAFFADLGVEWPEGSSIKFIPSIGKLVVKNTPDNMAKFEEVLATLNVIPNQLEIETQFVEFDMADIEASSRQGMISTEGLMTLRKQGKSRLISAPKLITQAGQEATVKGVTEYIYPTDFTVSTPDQASGTNAPAGTNAVAATAGGVVVPGAFETREVGDILSVMPQVSPDGTMIILTLSPEHVCEPIWKDYGRKADGPMEQPFFHSYAMSTQVAITDGATIVPGGGLNSRDGKKVVYTFISARRVDLEGKPLLKPAGEKR
jgi:type II secretory pathway component GspD/PulD (secretin)